MPNTEIDTLGTTIEKKKNVSESKKGVFELSWNGFYYCLRYFVVGTFVTRPHVCAPFKCVCERVCEFFGMSKMNKLAK